MSQAELEKAAEDVKNLTELPSNNDLLRLYGLYKQAAVGDNNTKKPDMFDLKGKYKWNAWNTNKGKTKEIAQQEYITLVRQLRSKL